MCLIIKKQARFLAEGSALAYPKYTVDISIYTILKLLKLRPYCPLSSRRAVFEQRYIYLN
ncbi:hypothetical protein CLV24_11276 [Pontibacter ummariensis]|uniref:Uncharacterized protein n=1 Tax=Pontibacter ummariensis TaxID=1610492 RepID=A0A239H0G3_9BACT|nr:hypothetical protein CLV24_11276 [Pontibacter ummariensis]SNS74615.1 hypothetical protein SAMN06296052_112102 [Pontibacter ummariensis]